MNSNRMYRKEKREQPSQAKVVHTKSVHACISCMNYVINQSFNQSFAGDDGRLAGS